MSAYETEGEAPLDPAAERLRRKLVRLLVFSGGIMVLGLIAVFSAIVYKVGGSGEGGVARLSATAPVEARLAIPAGARIVATALDGDRALLTLATPDGSTSLLLVDLASGAPLGRYSVEPGQ
jgi:hypothetical protein